MFLVSDLIKWKNKGRKVVYIIARKRKDFFEIYRIFSNLFKLKKLIPEQSSFEIFQSVKKNFKLP
jgi:hypothetical protein